MTPVNDTTRLASCVARVLHRTETEDECVLVPQPYGIEVIIPRVSKLGEIH